MDDPWFWTVERVVAELCSDNRSWEVHYGPLKFPPLDELEARLRREEVDGFTLLTLDQSELCQELNFTTLKQKATLKYAISIFRSRSHGFRNHMKRFNAGYESDNSKQGELAPSKSDEDANLLANQPQLIPTSSSLRQIPNSPQPLVNDDSVLGGHVSKRRRVVPMLVSGDIDGTLSRNIPTEADVISTTRAGKISTNGSQSNDDVIASPWAYLGQDALTRIDVLGNYPSLERDSEQMEDQVEFSYRREIPHGRRIQVHQLMKHHTLRIQKSSEFRGMRADLVPGANNPDHDDLLPLYGDSDEEYDSETWEEIEAEKAEQAEIDNQPGLNCDEVKAILDESIGKYVSDWKERKLLKLQRKANKIWLDARRSGLRRSIVNVRNGHDSCEARIARLCKEILEQKYRDVAEVKEQALILQQSVEDREHHSWVLGAINASVEPVKFRPLPRNSNRKSRALKPTALDEEILTSESEEDIGDFIVDDEPTYPDEFSGSSPMDIDNDDVSHGQQDIDDDDQNAESIKPDQRDTIDLTQLDEDVSMAGPSTPAKAREHHVVDLTTPQRLRIKMRSNSSTANGKPNTQEAQPSTLFMQIDDLEPAEQIVAKELTKLDQSYLNEVFTLVMDTRSESDWLYVMNVTLDHQDFPKPPHDAQKRKTLAVYTLLRLFEIYRDGVLLSVGRYKKLTYDDILEKMQTWTNGGSIPDKVNSYVDFLYRLSDRFEWKRCSPQAEGETSAPAKRRRHKKMTRNADAENLREADRERTAEQFYRRQMLRDKLKLGEYSGMRNLDTQKIIINESKGDHEGFIYVHPEIAQRIKDHQISGVRFMWNQIVDSATKQGCLLAHTMGLGKTMQIITLLVAIAEASESNDPTISSQIPEGLRKSRTLVICPPSLINNWMDEFLFWAPEGHKLGEFFKVDQSNTERQRLANIAAWENRGGILIIGYQLFKNIINDNEDVLEVLCESPNLVVADEAHEMKNTKSKTHMSTRNFRTHSRIALTGSPLANKVEEYHSMINWVAPNYLSDIREFRSEYANPIGRGLSLDATAYERRHAVKMLNALRQEVGPKVQRVTTSVLKHDIPTKQEFVLIVPLTTLQREAYESYVRFHQGYQHTDYKFAVLASGGTLGVLCAHPLILLKKLQKVKADSERDADTKNTLPDELLSMEIALINKVPDVNDYSLSWKIPILLSILEECKRVGDAVLIFSQSILTLNYLEHIIRTRKFSSVRLDGSVPTNTRQNTVKDFNKGKIDIFLISTRAGGVGLNMTTANRIILFDTRFNPQNELQAVGRAYRIGQKKQVYVYRLVCGGTLEESSFNLGIKKLQLTSRVVDEKKPIPKAGASNSTLQMPKEPVQYDISGFIGKDVVLDKVIEQHKSGIRNIIPMDTFEEEEHEEAALTAQECEEVTQMIERNERRRLGQKQTTQANDVAPTHHTDPPSSSHNAGSSLPISRLAEYPSGINNPHYFMECIAPHIMPPNFTEVDRRECEQIARSITLTIVSRKLPVAEQEQLFDQIQKAVIDFQFKFALRSRCISPEKLGDMNVDEIRNLHQAWKILKWHDCMDLAKRLKGDDERLAPGHQSRTDPEHLQYAIQKLLTPPAQNSELAPQKPQRLDDQKALEAVIERRKAKKPSKGKDPRLPNWAINAVTKQQRAGPSPAPSSTVPRTSTSASSHLPSKSPFK
ncbi:uncharacterized protein GGS22DRAFT_185976 [Annulohypoxylon maeteangense]|uniref:uncharacterized protein n=1 Tax=Annulohypoxylon maeteangense TaxID=1927788 RepID=UPI002007B17F|nr:uncharacterized protein GGS22DRAFT_185976 [Annulohypoxylon maeteangense]KAI0887140.1 hypothetical protein GGS22DRAFT_185976 [Annulohypoxylon maeteangense]